MRPVRLPDEQGDELQLQRFGPRDVQFLGDSHAVVADLEFEGMIFPHLLSFRGVKEDGIFAIMAVPSTWAVSSAAEYRSYTPVVAGSNPAPPTTTAIFSGEVSNSFSGAPESRAGVARRRGSPPARSGLAASTAGEEPRQDPARNWPDTGKRIANSGEFPFDITIILC